MERASAGIIMNFVEIMIGEKLKEADPALRHYGFRPQSLAGCLPRLH